MNEDNVNVADRQIDFPTRRLERRRKLLPWWVIVFLWLFLLFFSLMPVAIVMGLLKYNFQISLLGLTTNEPFSLTGISLMALFSLKGVTAFALWTEKTWAVRLSKIDAIISIAVCLSVMGYAIFALRSFSIRLELIVLAFYIYKMSQIQHGWENFDIQQSIAEAI
jgi:hypothetical protein